MAVVFQKPKALTDAVLHYCPGCTHGIVHRLVAEAIEFAVPQNAEVTISEQNGNYSTSFQLNDDPSEQTNSMSFTVADDTMLVVTNTLGDIIPTGLFDTMLILWEIVLLPAGITAIFLWYRKKHYRFPFR